MLLLLPDDARCAGESPKLSLTTDLTRLSNGVSEELTESFRNCGGDSVGEPGSEGPSESESGDDSTGVMRCPVAFESGLAVCARSAPKLFLESVSTLLSIPTEVPSRAFNEPCETSIKAMSLVRAICGSTGC